MSLCSVAQARDEAPPMPIKWFDPSVFVLLLTCFRQIKQQFFSPLHLQAPPAIQVRCCEASLAQISEQGDKKFGP